MVHKPKHKVHSFRGLLGDGGEDEINLERQNVNLAYRIVKLQLMPRDPGFASQESVVQVWKEKQTSIPTGAGSSAVDFTDPDLLAAAWLPQGNVSPTGTPGRGGIDIIFDNTLFSRNIYVTHTDNEGNSNACNYYLEIEEVPVTASTLMQIKLGTARRLGGPSMGN